MPQTATANFIRQQSRGSFKPIRVCNAIVNTIWNLSSGKTLADGMVLGQYISTTKTDISNLIVDWGQVIYQTEQLPRINVFSANTLSIILDNTGNRWDIDNATNFFANNGLNQDGSNAEFEIKIGFELEDGTTETMFAFTGRVSNIDVDSDNTVAHILLADKGKLLRDKDAHNIGRYRINDSLYGGEVFAVTTSAVALGDLTINVKAPTGKPSYFPSGFPPFGYVRINTEKMFFYDLTNTSLKILQRGVLGTTAATHVTNAVVELLLADGKATENLKFQFLKFPVSEESVTAASSDGGITINPGSQRRFGSLSNTQCTINYETGVITLESLPSDPTSLRANYKYSPKYQKIEEWVKSLFELGGFTSSNYTVDNIDFTDYRSQEMIQLFGRIDSDDFGNTFPYRPCYAVYFDSNNNKVYFGIGNNLGSYDGSKFTKHWVISDDTLDTIVALTANSSFVVGAYYDNSAASYVVFKWQKASPFGTTILADSTNGDPFYGTHDSLGNFTSLASHKTIYIDTTASPNNVWFPYYKSSGGNALSGIARVSINGGTAVKFQFSSVDVDSVKAATGLNFQFASISGTNYLYVIYSDPAGLNKILIDRFRLDLETSANVTNASGLAQPLNIIGSITNNTSEGRLYFAIPYYTAILTLTSKQIQKGRLYSLLLSSGVLTLVDFIPAYTVDDTKTYAQLGNLVYRSSDNIVIAGRGNTAITLYPPITSNPVVLTNQDMAGILAKVVNNVVTNLSLVRIRDDGIEQHQVAGFPSNFTFDSNRTLVWGVSSDDQVSLNSNKGYFLFAYGKKVSPLIAEANYNGKKIWTVLSDLASLVNFELGVDTAGKAFFRTRKSNQTKLTLAMAATTDTTITVDSTAGFDLTKTDLIAIENNATGVCEICRRTGATATTLTGLTRGLFYSTARIAGINDRVYELADVIGNIGMRGQLKLLRKSPNYDEIFNDIVVTFGSDTIRGNYKTYAETFSSSSENKYGRRILSINLPYLSINDQVLAENMAKRMYDNWSIRHTLYELETTWMPHLDLGDYVALKMSDQVLANYYVARVVRIEHDLMQFITRLTLKQGVFTY